MKILLIFPKILHGATTYNDKGSWTSIIFGYPVITLPHLAAITPKEHDVRILNENYEDIDFEEDVDLVAITCYTMTAPRVYEIADEFRRRGKKVILGGYHPTALPEEAIQHADSIIFGMAESSWPKLLDDFKKGKLKKYYEKDTSFDVTAIPPLRRDLIRHNPLLGALQATRGCANACEFCAISSFCGRKVWQRPIDDVIKEIKEMPNKIFLFHDPHLTTNRKYAKELFKTMIKEKIHKAWVANGTTNVLGTVDEEFLRLARKAGCVEWFVGFESVSQSTLDKIKKTHNQVKNFKKMIDRVHYHGMTIEGGIIFGFDEDGPDVFDMTLEKMYELEIDVVEINILTPYPGTPLFDRMEKQGRIITKDWSRYNQVDVVFKPKLMTEKELLEGTKKVAKEYYSWNNIIKRNAKALAIVKGWGAGLPLANNYNFRRYYKNEFGF